MKLNRNTCLSLIIFLVVFITHYESDVVTSSDSCWNIPVALNIIRNHHTQLDEFHQRLVYSNFYFIDSTHGHYYSKYSIGTSLMAVPFIYVIDKFSKRALGIDIYQMEQDHALTGLELLIASVIVGLTAILIFFTALYLLKNHFQALLITFIFAYCTSAWSTASRALWQHGPSMFILAIAFYLILKAKEKPGLVVWSALPLAFSYVIRPTDFIPVLFLTIYILINYRAYFIKYVLTSLVIAIPFFIYNYSVYHALLSPYYLGANQGHTENYFEAIAGNLISPSRGLLFCSPIFLFIFIGIFYRLKQPLLKQIDIYILLIITCHLLLFSEMRMWWGGWCFGPRYFTDVLPFLMYLLILTFEWINSKSIKQKLRFGIIVTPFILMSFYINYRGATHFSTFEWNYKPNAISYNTYRLWQWNDPQFLR